MNSRDHIARVLSHVFEAAMAWAFIMVALAFFTDPHATLVRSPVGGPVYPFDLIWNAFYLVGGMATFVGVAVPARRVELGGLIILGTGLLTAAVALASLQPDPRVFAYLSFAAAAAVRSFLIVHRG